MGGKAGPPFNAILCSNPDDGCVPAAPFARPAMRVAKFERMRHPGHHSVLDSAVSVSRRTGQLQASYNAKRLSSEITLHLWLLMSSPVRQSYETARVLCSEAAAAIVVYLLLYLMTSRNARVYVYGITHRKPTVRVKALDPLNRASPGLCGAMTG